MSHREPSACLAVLRMLNRLNPSMSLADAVMLVCVFENEGINFSELRLLTGFGSSLCSRGIRRFAAPSAQDALHPYLSLLEVKIQKNDRRNRTIHLTSEGIGLRAELDAHIAHARPILARAV